MSQKNLESHLQSIRLLLSHLHKEVTTLESQNETVLTALHSFEDQAQNDDLTGVYRRKEFFKRWKEVLKTCEELQENCGIILVDIDHFKKINDQLGHQTGDEVLQSVGRLLKQYQSPHCFSGRYGGEEFAIVVQGADADVMSMAERVRRSVEKVRGQTIGPHGKPDPERESWAVTLSAGVATSKQLGYDAQALLKAADEALYQAKANGRNRIKGA